MPLDTVSVYVGASVITLVVLSGISIYLSSQVYNLKKLHQKDKSGEKKK